jgi:hypothetical protein
MEQTPHSKKFKEQALRKLRERGSLNQQSIGSIQINGNQSAHSSIFDSTKIC